MEIHSLPNHSGIYGIRHIDSGKLYIGSAVKLRKRLSNHISDLNKKKHRSPRLQNAWNKYGANSFEVIIFIENVDKNELISVEQTYLDEYKCYLPEIGYNICKVAGSRLGMRCSETTKLKLSETSKVQWQDPVYVEYRRSLTKEQMKDKRKPFVCIQNNKLYQSTRDAAKELNLDPPAITKVLRGKINHTKGYSFKYQNEETPNCTKRTHSYKIVCNETNIVYDTCSAAALAMNISLSMVCQAVDGRFRKAAKGFTFSTIK